MMMIFGNFDGVVGLFAVGWAWDELAPADAQYVRILADRRPIGIVRADLLRGDLIAAGIGNGRHAFQYLLPPGLLDGREHAIEAVIVGTGAELHGSPVQFAGSSGEISYVNLRHPQAGAEPLESPHGRSARRRDLVASCRPPSQTTGTVAQQLRREGYLLLPGSADAEPWDIRHAGPSPHE
jgi:hypothetical protein